MLFNKAKPKIKKSQLIISIDEKEKELFKKLCEDNNLTMTDVLVYTINKINEQGEINSVDFRA